MQVHSLVVTRVSRCGTKHLRCSCQKESCAQVKKYPTWISIMNECRSWQWTKSLPAYQMQNFFLISNVKTTRTVKQFWHLIYMVLKCLLFWGMNVVISEEIYNAVYSVESQPTFQRNMSPPSPSRAPLATCFVLVSCLTYSSLSSQRVNSMRGATVLLHCLSSQSVNRIGGATVLLSCFLNAEQCISLLPAVQWSVRSTGWVITEI
jgi:hypothetical protein